MDALAVQWLGLRTSTAGGLGSTPGRGTEILQAALCGQKKKKKESILRRFFVLRGHVGKYESLLVPSRVSPLDFVLIEDSFNLIQ